ncbi:MAG: hypothetical protein J7L71_02975, partial [Spirochaetaceae bacterium]|nr:hypothetical protein [Spirochaetaceae bacterium]
VNLHRNMKLQEQPVPITELLDKRKSRLPLIFLIIFILAAAGAGIYFLYGYYVNNKVVVSVKEPVVTDQTENKNIYSYNAETVDIEERFPENSIVHIVSKENTYNIIVKSVGSNAVLSLSGRELVLNLGEDKSLDLNSDGIMDITLILNDIDISKKTASISIKTIGKEAKDNIKKAISETDVSETGVSETGVSFLALKNQDAVVIRDADLPETFVIDVNFRSNSLVRYIADSGNRIEKYFDKGESFRLDVNKELKLWISNAGSFNGKISGVEVNFGRSGEVTSYLIKWTKNSDSGKYELKMIPVL